MCDLYTYMQGGRYHSIHLRMSDAESRLDELYDRRVMGSAWKTWEGKLSFAANMRSIPPATHLAKAIATRALATGFNLTYVASQRYVL